MSKMKVNACPSCGLQPFVDAFYSLINGRIKSYLYCPVCHIYSADCDDLTEAQKSWNETCTNIKSYKEKQNDIYQKMSLLRKDGSV